MSFPGQRGTNKIRNLCFSNAFSNTHSVCVSRKTWPCTALPEYWHHGFCPLLFPLKPKKPTEYNGHGVVQMLIPIFLKEQNYFHVKIVNFKKWKLFSISEENSFLSLNENSVKKQQQKQNSQCSQCINWWWLPHRPELPWSPLS